MGKIRDVVKEEVREEYDACDEMVYFKREEKRRPRGKRDGNIKRKREGR